MSKIITKIELDGKIIFSKPLTIDSNLTAVRNLIKERVPCSFEFLDKELNLIDKSDEDSYPLGDIVSDKIIKLKSSKGNTDSGNSFKIFFGDTNICSINSEKGDSLNKVRNFIKNQIKDNFIFLDQEKNDIIQSEENEYKVEDILINETIHIKILKTNDSEPAKPITPVISNIQKENEKIKTKNKYKIKDFSKFKVLKKTKYITTYKYSDIERISPKTLVYQYFYDTYDVKDYTDAYIVLFCGKTGDGKSTAINAFFNIIKGVEISDNYRFILITEPDKKGGQAVSQTDGVHLYYLKDYANKPVIIIDSQGYGDTRGRKYDEMINEAFKHVFSEIIDHINTVCFISKSSNNRLDILTRYIFASVTGLFSDDITENFIVTATFANRETMEDGPAFVTSIQEDADFLNIKDRINQKWWYAFDSKVIFDNEEDKLTKFSVQQLKELYEEKVKKLRPKGVKKSAEVLETRKELKIQVNLLSDTYQNLLMEQMNLQEKEKVIDDISKKIEEMEKRIKTFEKDAQTLSPHDLERRMEELNSELNSRLNQLDTETETEYMNILEYDELNDHNHCRVCQRNCHKYCDCLGRNTFGRCTKFTFHLFDDTVCEECKCIKDNHKIDHYYWVKKEINKKKDNSSRIQEEKERNERDKQRYLEEINQKKNARNNLDKQINELNYNKNKLNQEKINNINEKNEIKLKIENTKNQVTFIIVKLKDISNKINLIAMNNNYLKTEEEYIDSLQENMNEIGIKDEEQKRLLQEQKNCIKVFRETNKLNENELMKLDDSQLAEKLNIIIPKPKKDK